MSFMSKEEKMTLESYKEISKVRNKTHSDSNFWRKQFEEFKEIAPKGRILEAGCGAGRDALLFKECGSYQYIGIDASPEMLTEARRLVPGVIFMEMNMYSLNFEKDFFDGFWAVVSLLHIPKSKVLGVFQRKIDIVLGQIRKVVKKNGVGFIAMKEGNGEKIIYLNGENPRLVVFYKEDEFKKILEKNGFEIIKSSKYPKVINSIEEVYLNYYVRVRK